MYEKSSSVRAEIQAVAPISNKALMASKLSR